MCGTTLPLRAVPTDRYSGTIWAIFSHNFCSLVVSKAQLHTSYMSTSIDIQRLMCVNTSSFILSVTCQLHELSPIRISCFNCDTQLLKSLLLAIVIFSAIAYNSLLLCSIANILPTWWKIGNHNLRHPIIQTIPNSFRYTSISLSNSARLASSSFISAITALMSMGSSSSKVSTYRGILRL